MKKYEKMTIEELQNELRNMDLNADTKTFKKYEKMSQILFLKMHAK